MSPERLAHLKENAPNYDDYSAREDVTELVAEVERLSSRLAQVVGVVYALAPLDVLMRVKDIINE